ncbi:hypothetical protein [Paludisphaera mucosa]|uniref:DUF2269 family protein n=1 Tax=Paludisphaera mucosa TaxID=3030827 RepID=A0ABT6FFQ5_9BACT|nr:hypothetical protein [Paludisphaera mucosa]MDG3006406.1 hypothetical protein [Paludisphaera mucosa]
MTGLQIFTLIHVAISLAGIASGFVVLCGLLAGKRLDGWTAFFLATTVATSVTGFGFPYHGFTPGIALGILSLVLLAGAIYARYARRLAGPWRPAYVVTAVAALYFNVFVLIVQSFQKVPALKALAPTQSERPFAVAQLLTLVAFLTLGYMAAVRFRDRAVEVIS